MQTLELVSQDREVSWYSINGEFSGEIGRWVATTPETRRICIEPEVVGVDFTRLMREGVARCLSSAPFKEGLARIPETRLCTVNFLRGSLNFGLREALRDALGCNQHTTCFMSSQRFRRDGRWQVAEDSYRKLNIPDAAVLIFGDVVATGVTVDNGLQVVARHMEEQGLRPQGLIFFTIGCHKIEKILLKYHQLFSKDNPDYLGTHVVYLEGKFKLVDSKTRLRICISGTDLVKPEALMAPELELELFDSIPGILERCVIYDAGSRAFNVPEYWEELSAYWHQLDVLAQKGLTLKEALLERWPAGGPGSGPIQRPWVGVGEEMLKALEARRDRFWEQDVGSSGTTREGLVQITKKRRKLLSALHKA